jgi:thiol-disulfide isomerase/thioredoxin
MDTTRRDSGDEAGEDHAATRKPAARRGRPVSWFGRAALLGLFASVSAADAPGALPAFTHAASVDWLNSAPLDAAHLRGRPVLLEVWTYECSNCLASLPWMQRIAHAYRNRGLVMVGVHSPELREEHDPAQVAAAVRRLGIEYPVMLDEDFSYWRSLGNRYWPAFYLFDAAGKLVATRIGELHAGEPGADSFERSLAAALPVPVGGS